MNSKTESELTTASFQQKQKEIPQNYKKEDIWLTTFLDEGSNPTQLPILRQCTTTAYSIMPNTVLLQLQTQTIQVTYGI
jgi:hypothetical protein